MTLVPQLDPVKTILNPDSVEFGTYASPSCLERRPYNWLDNIHIISGDSLKSADIALELGVELGSIINPIICRIGKDNFVTVLMAADMACDPIQVSKALRRPGEVVTRLSTAEIAAHTSMTPEAMFPIQLALEMPVLIDASLKRFAHLYSLAGSRKCMIVTTYKEIKELTQGTVSYALTSSDWSVNS